MNDKLERETVYCCKICGRMLSKDLVSIAYHIAITPDHQEYKEKLISEFTNQYKDYKKNPIFP